MILGTEASGGGRERREPTVIYGGTSPIHFPQGAKTGVVTRARLLLPTEDGRAQSHIPQACGDQNPPVFLGGGVTMSAWGCG